MSVNYQKTVVLFVDIVGSTKLYESIGDSRARQMCAQCIQDVIEITVLNSGVVVKTMGDGLMASFVSSMDAYNSAILMQECYEENQLSMTVGFHYGSVITEKSDLFGDTVNLAARVADKAKPGEILMTEEALLQLPDHYRLVTRLLDKAKLKGKTELVSIYTVLRQDVESTVCLPHLTMMPGNGKISGLFLLNDGQKISFDKSSLPISIGRDLQSDLVSKSPYASRNHAVIEFQRDRYVLTDHSSNGTYVKNRDAKELFLKRESVVLLGSGVISLGELPVEDNPFLINFRSD